MIFNTIGFGKTYLIKELSILPYPWPFPRNKRFFLSLIHPLGKGKSLKRGLRPLLKRPLPVPAIVNYDNNLIIDCWEGELERKGCPCYGNSFIYCFIAKPMSFN